MKLLKRAFSQNAMQPTEALQTGGSAMARLIRDLQVNAKPDDIPCIRGLIA